MKIDESGRHGIKANEGGSGAAIESNLNIWMLQHLNTLDAVNYDVLERAYTR